MLDPNRPNALGPYSYNGQRNARDEFPLASLQQVPLFQKLSLEELKAVSGVVKRRTIVPDELLLTEDDVDSTLFLIMEGAFKVTVRKGESTVLLGLCGRGELLGELAAIDGHARSATVTAQTPCTVGVVSASNFWDKVWPLPVIPLNMAHLLTGRVRRLTAKVQAMATLDVRGRLAYQMVSLARDHGDKAPDKSLFIPFGLTQLELAQMVGTSRVQVNQLMITWTRHGILTAKRNCITVNRLDSLCQMFPASLDAIVPRSARELN
ncbi:cAMP-activated global transcriptional regulator CRP [Abditibacteriota bacterium]|nr:cAMP-activated global transcriptional regulator CRP [Abditibacteriota bacterium]